MKLRSYIEANRLRFLSELARFVKYPSVSSDSNRKGDIGKCAVWLANHLKLIGLENVNVIPTGGHPLVYADWIHRPGITLLIYGHYDVQPPGDLEKWLTPPFEPIVRSNNIYGRGASDDKGQLFVHIKSLEYYFKIFGALPVNVICIFEGEEEIGSPNLAPFLSKYSSRLKADIALISDTASPGPEMPAITYSMRGSLGLELEIRGPGQELHSGIYGGAIHNPLQALCEMVSALHDNEGRITIPGFYERVQDCSLQERMYMAKTGPSDRKILNDAHTKEGWGEQGYTLYERTTIRPSLTISGIKTSSSRDYGGAIIPSRATADLNFRLAFNQDPHEIEKLFRKHIVKISPNTVETTVRRKIAVKPVVTNRTHPAFRAAAAACKKSFGKYPLFLRSGGTIPVASILKERLGIETVLMGFALPDDNLHGPNEKFSISNFFRGIAASASFMMEMKSSVDPLYSCNTGMFF